MKHKTEKSKPKCGVCGSYKKVKYYIIADDIENPRPRCKKCMDELTINVLIHLSDKDLYSTIEPCNRKRSKNRRKGVVR